MEQKKFSARQITILAVLLALVIVLQVFASSIKIGTVEITLTLVPIVLGSICLGPLYGGMLGFVFGVIAYLAGVTGASPFTYVLFSDSPVLTAVICLVKGTAAGLGAGLAYKLLSEKNELLATFCAAGIAPILNTGLFVLGMVLMKDTLYGSGIVPSGTGIVAFFLLGQALINFIVEFTLNMILSPSLSKVIKLFKKEKR